MSDTTQMRGVFTQIAVNRLVRPVWYALVAYGALWLPGGSQHYGDALDYAAGPDTESRRDRLRAS